MGSPAALTEQRQTTGSRRHLAVLVSAAMAVVVVIEAAYLAVAVVIPNPLMAISLVAWFGRVGGPSTAGSPAGSRTA